MSEKKYIPLPEALEKIKDGLKERVAEFEKECLNLRKKEVEAMEKKSPPGKKKEVEKLKEKGLPASEAFGIAWDQEKNKKLKKDDGALPAGGDASFSGIDMEMSEDDETDPLCKKCSKLKKCCKCESSMAKNGNQYIDLHHENDPEKRTKTLEGGLPVKLPDDKLPVNSQSDEGSGSEPKKMGKTAIPMIKPKSPIGMSNAGGTPAGAIAKKSVLATNPAHPWDEVEASAPVPAPARDGRVVSLPGKAPPPVPASALAPQMGGNAEAAQKLGVITSAPMKPVAKPVAPSVAPNMGNFQSLAKPISLPGQKPVGKPEVSQVNQELGNFKSLTGAAPNVGGGSIAEKAKK